jgi:glycosyltransferase A (GT-A) superfamily protein (DUF2064 family)
MHDESTMNARSDSSPHRRGTAVVVFTRAPDAEPKQFGFGDGDRLVAQALVAGTLATVTRATTDADVVVVSERPIATGPAGGAPRVAWAAQRPGGFEDRLLGALDDVAAMGYTRLVVVGSDTPDLEADDIRAAVTAPAGRATVGPSRDGGFYLLGIESRQVGLLRGLPWRRSTLLAALCDRLDASGIAHTHLRRRADVDDARDAHALQRVLERLCRRYLGAGLDGRSRPAGVCAVSDAGARSDHPIDLGPPRSPPRRFCAVA